MILGETTTEMTNKDRTIDFNLNEQKDGLLSSDTEDTKDRAVDSTVPTVTLCVFAVLSIIITQGINVFSHTTDHFPSFTIGQIACTLAFVFFLLLWAAIHGATICMALQAMVSGHDFWKGLRHHRNRFVSEENMKYIDAAAELAAIMILFYVCDRTDFLPRAEKHYDRDTYWFILLAVFGASLFTIKKDVTSGHAPLLQREQTEEWKGWMQIQFLMYHYFHAAEYYNSIRCYIAAYVWMTGFGNFSFYYVKKDFGLSRFCAMQWRLNFFVFWCCFFLANEYMLYYICMLHTTFTVIIYGLLGIMQEQNYSAVGMRLKFVVILGVIFLIWDVPGVFPVLWAPFRWLVDYKGSLHEWTFRSGLDHLVWIPGMMTAFAHPTVDAWLERLDTMPFKTQYGIKTLVVTACLVVGWVWYEEVFVHPKKVYNGMHPYTSFVPITLYIILRNISSRLRCYHLGLFAWMGKITLETYISQFHIWMTTLGPNENPKKLLRLCPEGYPLLNFSLVSIMYVFISYRIFQVTGTLKHFAIPLGKDGPAKLKRNLIYGPILVLAFFLMAFTMGTLT